MTIEKLYRAIGEMLREHPEKGALEAVIEYPNGNGSSDITKINSIDFDECDFIISYYELYSNPQL